MLGSLWLIPALCLGGAVVNLALGALGARKPAVTVIGVGSVGAGAASDAPRGRGLDRCRLHA